MGGAKADALPLPYRPEKQAQKNRSFGCGYGITLH